MSDQPGAKALVPNSALQPLSFLVGAWRTECTHPQMPGETLIGRTAFAWHEGGAFLLMRSQVDHPDFPDGVAIIGSDQDTGHLAMAYFDQRGVSRLLKVEAAARQVTWRHDGANMTQILTITANDGDTLISQGRMSMNGGPWGNDLSQIFSRDGSRTER